MARTLLNLIKASGYSGVAGQSFRNNVTGAGTGVKMSDYNLDGWVWDTAGAPTAVAWPYASGTSWAMTFTFTEGSKAKLIRRIAADGLGPTVHVLSYSADDDISGEDISITTSSINSSDSLGSATLQLIASTSPTATVFATADSRDYEDERGSR